MTGLQEAFDEEFRRLSDAYAGTPEFDELGATRSVRRRRSFRAVGAVAAGVAGAAVVGAGALALGTGETEPAATLTPSPSASASATGLVPTSPSPSPSVTDEGQRAAPAPTVEQAGPGWFLLDVQTETDTPVEGANDSLMAERSTDTLLIVSPQGETIEVLNVGDYDASWPVAWFGDELALLRQELSAGSFGWAGELLRVDLGSGRVVGTVAEDPDSGYAFSYQPWIGAVDGGERIVTGEFGGDGTDYAVGAVDQPSTALCSSGMAPTSAALSPTGDRVVCFAGDDSRTASDGVEGVPATSVVVSATDGSESVEIAQLSRYPGNYQFSGWLTDSVLLFGREGDDSDLVYFTLDTDTGDVDETTVPLASSASLALYDARTATYVRTEGTDVGFHDTSGATIATARCSDALVSIEARTVFSGDRAVVMCGGSPAEGGDGSGSRAALWLVDLVDGGATEIDLSAYPDGGYRTLALPYWGPDGS